MVSGNEPDTKYLWLGNRSSASTSSQYSIRGFEVDHFAYMTCTASKGSNNMRVGLL